MKFKVFMPLAFGAALFLASCTTLPAVNNQKNVATTGSDWVAYSAEWRQEAEDVFDQATSYVQAQASQRDAGSWVVVMDLDETVMNNVGFQLDIEGRGLSYTPELWYDWTQQEAATLVPGAYDFIEQVNKLGGLVVFVTNRRDTEQLATENNLAELGIYRSVHFKALLTRATPNGTSSKELRFTLVPEALKAQGYPNTDVIVFVGDNIGDKPEQGNDWKFFCIDQGAMYGEPCAEVPGSGS